MTNIWCWEIFCQCRKSKFSHIYAKKSLSVKLDVTSYIIDFWITAVQIIWYITTPQKRFQRTRTIKTEAKCFFLFG